MLNAKLRLHLNISTALRTTNPSRYFTEHFGPNGLEESPSQARETWICLNHFTQNHLPYQLNWRFMSPCPSHDLGVARPAVSVSFIRSPLFSFYPSLFPYQTFTLRLATFTGLISPDGPLYTGVSVYVPVVSQAGPSGLSFNATFPSRKGGFPVGSLVNGGAGFDTDRPDNNTGGF